MDAKPKIDYDGMTKTTINHIGTLEPLLVRLLVREMSGAWYVDQGFMPLRTAKVLKSDWNRAGYGCLILKHWLNTANLPIVPRPNVTWKGGNPCLGTPRFMNW